MLKKEWREILLPAALRLMIGPLLFLLDSVISGKIATSSYLLFLIGYAVSVFWVALHMGLNAFHAEFQDHAFEYMLTFPVRRLRLLARKFLVRFLVLGILVVLHVAFQHLLEVFSPLPLSHWGNAFIFDSYYFSFFVFSYFCVGFFLSLVDWGSARPAIPVLILIGQELLAVLLKKPLQHLLGTDGLNNGILCRALLVASAGIFFMFCFRKLLRGNLGNGWSKRKKKPVPLFLRRKNGGNWGLLRHETWIVGRSFFLIAWFAPVLFYLCRKVFVSMDGWQQSLLDPLVIMAAIVALLIIFFAFFSGSSSFFKEFRYKALEYVLTFPLDFKRVLADKLLARVIILLPAVLAYTILAGHYSERLAQGSGYFYWVLHPAYFPFWVALMLANGFFLSLFEMKNMMALVSLASMYTMVLVPLGLVAVIGGFPASSKVGSIIIAGSGLVLTTLILGIVFSRIWPRFDLAAPLRYSRTVGLLLFMVFTLVSLASLTAVIIA
ncbi:MAG: hypothetical protein PHX05_04105 [Acidobacteriota bacterium]|nr:hypothetical protein [Acidobacteriota bacterium]